MLTPLPACTRLVVGRSWFTFLVAIAMATSSVAALAAPAPSGLVVAQSAACRVALVAASYDDPGADDAEFLELRVDMLATGSLGTRTGGAAADGGMNGECSSDAGAAGDAQVVPGDAGAAAGPVLGDCGLGGLELVDGASAACETYRTIPLSLVPIPKDGYVVLCPAGSSVDARAHCDVTSAGRSALRAGWLQNGPNDGFRFVDNRRRRRPRSRLRGRAGLLRRSCCFARCRIGRHRDFGRRERRLRRRIHAAIRRRGASPRGSPLSRPGRGRIDGHRRRRGRRDRRRS